MLIGFQFETARSDMTNFAIMMASRDKPLKMLSLMRRDIFRHRRLYNIFFFLRIIIFIPRSLDFNSQQFGLM
jgi:hypothetical protein